MREAKGGEEEEELGRREAPSIWKSDTKYSSHVRSCFSGSEKVEAENGNCEREICCLNWCMMFMCGQGELGGGGKVPFWFVVINILPQLYQKDKKK